MFRIKKIFECTKCGQQFPVWEGRCRECGSWGTLVENQVSKGKSQPTPEFAALNEAELIDFSKIKSESLKRIEVGELEIDRVLGGGLVPGSLILLGGDPGIGKSTLVLKVASLLSQKGIQLFYVSGEETAGQLKVRVDKMKIGLDNVKFINNTDIDTIVATLNKYKPQVAVIDSIQTMKSSDSDAEAGSIGQIKQVTAKLMEVAKQFGIIVIIIGHVTKGGEVAGPKTMEHLVDVVLYLEGEKIQSFRILRAVKNRFGSTGEVGIFRMTNKGLEAVDDPAGIFLSSNKELKPGIVHSVIWEGTRAFVVELQALVSKSSFGYPKRTATGLELNRIQVFLAVLSKQGKVKFEADDVYVNLAGGLKAKDPGLDLAVCLALASAKKNTALKSGSVVIGEVSLTGEVKAVSNMEKRVKEAVRLGLKQIIIPKSQIKLTSSKVNIVEVGDIEQALLLIR